MFGDKTNHSFLTNKDQFTRKDTHALQHKIQMIPENLGATQKLKKEEIWGTGIILGIMSRELSRRAI